jgi:hypothetical protein
LTFSYALKCFLAFFDLWIVTKGLAWDTGTVALFYVTGLSGTGKSAVLGELRARGYPAYGVDEDGYADWINRVTGTPDDFPHDDPDLDFHAWYKTHEWVLSAERIGVLSQQAARLGGPVFLCGTADGDATVWHLFEKVLALVADAPTLKRRIAARTNEFGKAPEELAAILRWHVGYEAAYRRFGAVIIHAAHPLDQVVDEILAAALPVPRYQDENDQ